jgi:hypothetical protein
MTPAKVIETHEHKADFKEPGFQRVFRAAIARGQVQGAYLCAV